MIFHYILSAWMRNHPFILSQIIEMLFIHTPARKEHGTRPCLKWDSHTYIGFVAKIAQSSAAIFFWDASGSVPDPPFLRSMDDRPHSPLWKGVGTLILFVHRNNEKCFYFFIVFICVGLQSHQPFVNIVCENERKD